MSLKWEARKRLEAAEDEAIVRRVQRKGARRELWGVPDILRLNVFVPFLVTSLVLQCPLPSNPCLKSCVPSWSFKCCLLHKAPKVPLPCGDELSLPLRS